VHVRGTISTISASGVAEGPFRGRRGSWMVSVRQSYLDWIIRKLDKDNTNWLGFTDGLAKGVVDLTPRHALTVTLAGGRSHLEDRAAVSGNNSLHDAFSKGGLASVGLRSSWGAWIWQNRIFGLANRFQNLRADDTDLGSGRRTIWGYRADLFRQMTGHAAIEAGWHVERIGDRRQVWWYYDRRKPWLRLASESVDASATTAGGYMQVRWQDPQKGIVTAGGRVDHTSALAKTTFSPWMDVERRLGHGFTVRGGTGIYRQTPAFDQIFGVHGGGTGLDVQRAYHADLALEQQLGPRARWQLVAYTRQERDVVFAAGLEPRLVGNVVVTPDPNARFVNRLSGSARGIEFLLQRTDPNGVSGWMAYSYGHTRYRDRLTGESFDGDYDQRHALNVYAAVRLSSRTTAVGKFRAGSNIPLVGYNAETGNTSADGLPLYVAASTRNTARLPAYARLDLRINQTFEFGTRRLTLFVELINVFDRTNLGRAGTRSVENMLPFVRSAGMLIEF
jgi:hypothetical protein